MTVADIDLHMLPYPGNTFYAEKNYDNSKIQKLIIVETPH